MDCLQCHEDCKEPLQCSSCGDDGCLRCWPHYDSTSDLCPACQERSAIAALSEDRHTAKLRRIFNRSVPAPVQPRLVPPLPWRVQHTGVGWTLFSGIIPVAVFSRKELAEWSCRAANEHHTLLGVAWTVHERIRKGDGWFDGGREDCTLWSKTKTLLK